MRLEIPRKIKEMIVNTINPTINLVIKIKCFLQIINVLCLSIEKKLFGYFWCLSLEYSCNFFISDNFKRGKAIEKTVKNLSEHIISKSSNSSIVLDNITFQFDLFFSNIDNCFLFHSIHLTLNIGSLWFIEMRLFWQTRNVKVTITID